jgi:hypothetical protein
MAVLLPALFLSPPRASFGSSRLTYPPVPWFPGANGCTGLRHPSPPLTAAQMGQIDEHLMATEEANLVSGGPCPGGPVIVSLKPGREWLARELAAVYGDKLVIYVGLTAWDGKPGRSPVCGRLPRSAPLPRGLSLAFVPDSGAVTSGDDFVGQVALHEQGPGTLSMNIGQPLEAVLVRPGTERVVGVYAEGIAGTGQTVRLAPSQSTSVHVVGGTARCDGGTGSALPAGTYWATVLVTNEGTGPSPYYFTHPVTLRVLPAKP